MALRKMCSTCGANAHGKDCKNCLDHSNWKPKEDPMSKVENGFSPTIGGIPNVMREVVGMDKLKTQQEESGTTIVLKIMDESAMALANTIRKYVSVKIDDIETALIYLDELSEHIDTYVRAERKWLEYQKRKEE